MAILMALSSDQEANAMAVEAINRLSGVEVKWVPTPKELERHIHLPFIQLENNDRRYGLDDILDYVEMELEEQLDQQARFRIPQVCFFVADMSEPDAIRALEAVKETGFLPKLLDVPGYEKCDFSQPMIFCGEYNHKGADSIIDFVQRAGRRKEWQQTVAG